MMNPEAPNLPDGVSISARGTLVAVVNGHLVAEAWDGSNYTIYDWTPSPVLDEFTARLKEAPASEPLDDPLT